MTVSYDYTGKVALVTGASSGLGSATARAFAEAGARTVLIDIDKQAVTNLAFELESEGLSVLALTADVGNEDQVRSVIDTIVSAFGRIDFAFNNAGIMIPAAEIADTDNEVFDRVTNVNLRGVWNSMKHELIHMRSQGSGSIVNCSSNAGLVGNPTRAAYAATKHAIVGLTKSAALETGAQGIRVNAVNPGTISTPMVDRMIAAGELQVTRSIKASAIPRLGDPAEVAGVVLWLCSTGASYVTGVALPVDGGYVAK